VRISGVVKMKPKYPEINYNLAPRYISTMKQPPLLTFLSMLFAVVSASIDSTKATAVLARNIPSVVSDGCITVPTSRMKKLAVGAALRIASDLTGGTPLENIKTRVSSTNDNFFQAIGNINSHGICEFYRGTPARLFEGSLIGGLFILSNSAVRNELICRNVNPVLCSLAGGLVGGLAQTVVMAPSTQIMTTALNDRISSFEATKRIIRKRGILGLYSSASPVAVRQASNWASRTTFTEIARTTLGMSKYGIMGEIGSGVFGGLLATWNTPIETVRVRMQNDIGSSKSGKQKSMSYYFNDIRKDDWRNLFRGITPRSFLAVWQTTFMITVPILLGGK